MSTRASESGGRRGEGSLSVLACSVQLSVNREINERTNVGDDVRASSSSGFMTGEGWRAC